ncbi:MAG: Macrolide-specific efflux protein MacA precursor [Planctomycetota bacterium]|jgi:RND family efflux transporter MFP subunit
MRARDRILPLLLVTLSACGGKPAATGPTRPAGPTRAVRLLTVATTPLPRSVTVHGTLAALDELDLGFQVAGRVEALDVDLGDRVAAGRELARLDRRDFELEHARARAELNQTAAQLGLDDPAAAVDVAATASVREAEAVLAEATQNRDRVRELVQQSLRSPADLDVAVAAHAVASSRLQRARDQVRTWIAELAVRRQQLAIVEKKLADATIRAPWDGRVAARHAAVGQYLSSGTRVLTLLRTDPLRLRCDVPEREAAGIAVGQRVEFTVEGSEETFRGEVSRLGSQIDRNNRTLQVEASTPNSDGKLLPGGFCRARIVVAEAEPAVVVPTAAVVSFAGVDRVFLVEQDKAVERIVTLGRRSEAGIEIVRGLAAGERIVAEPGDLVRGAAVKVEGN